MNFFDYIREWFINATQFFINLALESYYSWYIPDFMGDMFNALSTFTSRVAGYLWDASNWYDWLAYKITTFLSGLDLELWFSEWKQKILDVWYWFNGRWKWFIQEVGIWWSSVTSEVQGWIDVAKQGLETLIAQANTLIGNLQESWGNFKGKIPTIDQVIYWWSNWTGNVTAVISAWWTGALLQVQGLINSAFIEREPFWAGWQDWRDKVIELFSDPEKWLLDRIESMLVRFL